MYEPTNNNNNNKNNNKKSKIPIDYVIMSTGINTIQNDANWNGGYPFSRIQKMKLLRDWISKQWFTEKNNNNNNNNENDDSSFQFIWHSVSPVCPNMPHFRRYRFRKSKWSNQPVDVVTNKGTKLMNSQMKELFFPAITDKKFLGKVRFLDSDGVLDHLDKEDETEVVDMTQKRNKNNNDHEDSYQLQHQFKHLRYPNYLAGKGIVVPSMSNTSKSKSAAAVSQQQQKDVNKKTFPKYCLYYEDPLHHRFLDRVIVDTLMTMIC